MSHDAGEETLALLRSSVRGLLDRRWPADAAPRLADDEAAVASLWGEAAGLGLTALGEPGGAGGVAAAMVALEELGRAACPLPLLGSLLAGAALDGASEEAAGALRRGLTDGTHAVAVGLGVVARERGGGGLNAAADGSGRFHLRGSLRYVETSPVCTHLLVTAQPGPLLALVDLRQPGIRTVPAHGLAVPPLCDVVFDSVRALDFWETGDAEIEGLVLLARLGCSARALGAAEKALELALGHARTRQQFGSPIGHFQAVQHRLADCATLRDAVRLLVERAGRALDGGAAWRADVSAATAFAGPALRRIARDAQHVLAGVGYIEEHEAPRHFRRVHVDTLRFGGAPAGRAELATRLLDS